MRTARLLLRDTLTATLIGCSMIWAGTLPAQSTEASIEQLWRDASAAQQAQQFSRAATLYEKILSLQPDLIEAEINLGLMHQLSGDLHAAMSCFQHALAKDQTLYAPNLLIGLDYLKLDDPGDALPYLKRATASKPHSAESLVGLANSYLQLHRYSEAEEQFKQATELQDGKNADAWYGLGATYFSMEKEAEGGLRHSSSPFRDVLLGEAYLEQGQQDKAIATLKGVVDGPSPVPCARSLLGFAYLRNSKNDDAAKEFQLDWNPQSSSECLLAKLGMAAAFADRGDRDDALRELREAAEIDLVFVQKNADSFWNYLTKAGAETGTREILGLMDTVDVEKARPSLAEGFWNHGRYSACSSALAASSVSLNVLQLRLLSRCSYYTDRDELVLDATARLLKASPADPEALYWRIQSAERLGLSSLSTATSINPESVSLHVLMGDMLRGKGSSSDAANEYRKAIALKPEFIAAHLGLARDLNSDGNTAGAESEVQYVLNLNPDEPEANYLMGEILVNRSEFAAALPFLLKAVHVVPGEALYVHADLSRIYEERGEFARAIAEIEQALPADIDGSYYYRLGRLHQKTGNRAAAARALEQSSELRRTADSAAHFEHR
jgi:tetratricopeptide (TPR) repeat protein